MTLDGNIKDTTDGVLDWVNTQDVITLRRAVILGCALFWGIVAAALLF